MELEGRLNESISLPEILQFLSMGKMTGALSIVHGDYNVSLRLRHGKLVNSSSLGRPRKLGLMLVNRGLVERSVIEDALQSQKQSSIPLMLGQILVQRGLITTEQLRQAIRLQLEEEMWDLFGISDGSFKFEHGDEASVGDVLIELDIDPLLLEGTRRMDEWARIVKNIPDEEAIPGVVPFQDPADRELMTFSDNEWRVISLINGASSIKSIAGRSGIGRFETFRIMNSFLAAGHIALSTAEQLQAVSAEDTGEMHVHGGNGNGSHKALFPENTSQPRRPAPERKKATAGKFVSPVAFLAAAADSILAELRNTSDFYMGPADDKFAEVQWRKVINEYPKADLVRALGNTMSTERFDDYVSIVGIEGEFRPCYEETFEALSRYLRNLYLAAAQRLGTKAAQNIFNRTFTELKGRSEIQNGEQFHLKDYASKVTA